MKNIIKVKDGVDRQERILLACLKIFNALAFITFVLMMIGVLYNSYKYIVSLF